MKTAYLFFYKPDWYSRTEYIYIVAYSLKQAYFMFNKRGYRNNADYGYTGDTYNSLRVNKLDVEIYGDIFMKKLIAKDIGDFKWLTNKKHKKLRFIFQSI